MNKGDILKNYCIACDALQIWEIEKITTERYSDGKFKTYHLKALKNCMGDSVRTSVKDCPTGLQEYEQII